MSDFDVAGFRRALGCFATGVTVVTTRDAEGAPVGLTANSFTSLSLDPPLVLFCIDRKSLSFPAFCEARHFAVNVLGADQRDLSARFARSDIEKFDGIDYRTWDDGCPILDGCLANFECALESSFDGGDHVILVGRVTRLRTAHEGGRPLLFFRGRYGELDGA